MAFFDWRSDLEIGDENIDQQHKKIIELVNELDMARSKDNIALFLGLALEELEEYTIFHFDQEEELMRDIGHTELRAHQRMHREIREVLLEFKNEFSFGKGDIENFMSFLKKWWTEHISVEDMKLKPLIKK